MRVLFFISFLLMSSTGFARSVAGLYNAILYHQDSEFYQYAKITLRTVNVEGKMKISANLRVHFGDWDSNEYLTYEYEKVPLNVLTRQVSIGNQDNDVSMIGYLKDETIEGEWFSTIVGKVGTFKAVKNALPVDPEGMTRVTTVSGYYRGDLENTNPESNLPDRISVSFVTTQSTSNGSPEIKISGNCRFYLGPFESQEYIETPFSDVHFNFYNRFLTAKTSEYGITLKGYLNHAGEFEGEVFSDGMGKVGIVNVVRHEGSN